MQTKKFSVIIIILFFSQDPRNVVTWTVMVILYRRSSLPSKLPLSLGEVNYKQGVNEKISYLPDTLNITETEQVVEHSHEPGNSRWDQQRSRAGS